MRTKLSDLHEQFIDQARRPMSFGRSPITAREPVPILVPIDRWQTKENSLVKKFMFRRPEDRIRFVTELMEYEDQVQHHAQMMVGEGEVILKLVTKTVETVTESDKEYSLYADALFKDIVFTP